VNYNRIVIQSIRFWKSAKIKKDGNFCWMEKKLRHGTLYRAATAAPVPTRSAILLATAAGYPRESISCTVREAPSRSLLARKARVIAS
jgi:hypothetical protein